MNQVVEVIFIIIYYDLSFSISFSSNQMAFISILKVSKKLARELGIPEPPKKPINGFCRFMQENDESIRKNSKSQRDRFVQAASKWKQLSETEKAVYTEKSKKDLVSHRACLKYSRFHWQNETQEKKLI